MYILRILLIAFSLCLLAGIQSSMAAKPIEDIYNWQISPYKNIPNPVLGGPGSGRPVQAPCRGIGATRIRRRFRRCRARQSLRGLDGCSL